MWVQIQLSREACFYAGQKFILRSTNPLLTIGGGTIVDIVPDRPRRVTQAEQDRAHYFELSNPAVFEIAALAKKWMCAQDEFLTDDLSTASGLVWHRKLDALAVSKLGDW